MTWPHVNLFAFVPGMAAIGLGNSLVAVSLNRLLLADVPPERAGFGGGVVVTLQQTGFALAVMTARGSAEWKGDVPTGSGTFTAGDSISGGYTFKSRFEDGPGSNPEQLIAAAHAACFSIALSNILAQAGNPADSVRGS